MNPVNRILGDKYSKDFRCNLCGQEMGSPSKQRNEYEILRAHMVNCRNSNATTFNTIINEDYFK